MGRSRRLPLGALRTRRSLETPFPLGPVLNPTRPVLHRSSRPHTSCPTTGLTPTGIRLFASVLHWSPLPFESKRNSNPGLVTKRKPFTLTESPEGCQGHELHPVFHPPNPVDLSFSLGPTGFLRVYLRSANSSPIRWDGVPRLFGPQSHRSDLGQGYS